MSKVSILRSIFSEDPQSVSSKRVIAISCMMMLFILALISAFRPITINDTILTGIITYGCVAMGGATVDKFTKKPEEKAEVSVVVQADPKQESEI